MTTEKPIFVRVYGSYLSAREEQDRFLQRVNDSLRKTLQEMFGAALIGGHPVQPLSLTTNISSEPVEGSGEIADEFMENFI